MKLNVTSNTFSSRIARLQYTRGLSCISDGSEKYMYFLPCYYIVLKVKAGFASNPSVFTLVFVTDAVHFVLFNIKYSSVVVCVYYNSINSVFCANQIYCFGDSS